MARLTQAERIANAEKIESERLIKVAEFRKTIPALLAKLTNLAKEVGVNTNIVLRPDGTPNVSFYDDSMYIDAVLNCQSDEWQLANMHDILSNIKYEQISQRNRIILAAEVWHKLTKDEQLAIKENIVNLKLHD